MRKVTLGVIHSSSIPGVFMMQFLFSGHSIDLLSLKSIDHVYFRLSCDARMDKVVQRMASSLWKKERDLTPDVFIWVMLCRLAWLQLLSCCVWPKASLFLSHERERERQAWTRMLVMNTKLCVILFHSLMLLLMLGCLVLVLVVDLFFFVLVVVLDVWVTPWR